MAQAFPGASATECVIDLELQTLLHAFARLPLRLRAWCHTTLTLHT